MMANNNELQVSFPTFAFSRMRVNDFVHVKIQYGKHVEMLFIDLCSWETLSDLEKLLQCFSIAPP